MSAWQGNTNADYRALYDRRAGDEQEVQLHYSAFPVIRRLEETLDVATSIRYSKVLDVGCGDGIFLSKLINSCKVSPDSISWIGVDISCKRLKRAKRSGAEVVVTDAVALPFSREQFDLVICTEVLEHIPDVDKAISELVRVTTPGGVMLLSIPVVSWLRTLLVVLGRRISYLDKEEHLREYSYIKLDNFEPLIHFFRGLESEGMVVTRSRGVYFYTQLGDIVLSWVYKKATVIAGALRLVDMFLGRMPIAKYFGRYLVLEVKKRTEFESY